jgi:hypothetical protein
MLPNEPNNIRPSQIAAEKILDLNPTLRRRAAAMIFDLMADPDFRMYPQLRRAVGWTAVALSRVPEEEEVR